ncbi:MAG TPA: DUF4175 family protein [Pyrinomonadaceae bacterium]|nr:DUF4175 family protein [Pyrinomonadaceae bacterium]
MNPETNLLDDLLRKARSRRQLLLSLRGVAITVGVVAVVLLLTGWAAHRYRYNTAALLVLRIGALLTVLATFYFALVQPLLKRITDARLARLIEEKSPGTEDRLVTAVEFANNEPSRVSPALVTRLYRDANSVSATLDVRNIIRRSRLLLYGGAALASLLLFAGVLKWGPREISEGVAQLVTPTALASSPNAMSIKVKPGTARVPKGSDQDILASLVNFDSQTVTVFSRPLGSKEDFQGQPMEPAKARSDFRYSIFNIQDSVEYFVESNTVRSEVYKLNVVDLPFVKQLDLTLNFPAFTNLPTKTIEDGGDIAALKGTVATVTAKLSSGKVRAARIVFADGKKTEMRLQGSDFVGEITVAGDTSYYIELVSNDGEAYRGSNEYDVSVLSDQPPVISFDKPGRDKKATNLEEVFTQARAEDDYGVVSMDLHFSINGGEEKNVNLQQLTRESARSLSGAYTFFLEEYNLKPGDFISYYAKARDASNESTSDIYFIEVKPFEMEYKQSQQQQGGGGQGGEQEQNALSRRQKDLIAATHRLIREGEKYTDQERKDGYEAVAAGQEKLRTDTLEFLDRMGRRLGDVDEGQKQVKEMAEHLRQATKEMEGAPPPLRKEVGKDALPPEQRALQRLLAADAIFREVQVAFGNQSSGSGSGSQREQQELAGLFELELDKMKNQYETVQRAQQQQAEQQKSEAERRLEELARRQQAALEEQRRRAQQAANGGGGGGSQRQQQELIDETRKAARELERLSRERRDAQMQELSRQLNQTADEMQKAQASARTNSSDAIAQNERALERLRQAQERLQQMSGSGQRGGQSAQSGSSGRQQQIADLRQRAAQAASRQREIAKDMESLSRRGGQSAQDENSRKAREQLAERKDALADSVSGLQQDIEQSARAMGAGQGQGQQRAARQLKDAADGLARDRVAERIREGKQALNGQQGQQGRGQQGQNQQGGGQQNGGQQNQGQQGQGQEGQQNGQGAGRTDERAIERSLNNLSERLQAAEQSARGANGSSAEENLDRTRQLADNLDSLRRRLDENARRNGNGQQQQGNQPGQQPGQQGQKGQQGQQGQEGQGQEGQQGQRGQQGQQGQGQQGSEGGQQQGQQASGLQNGGQSTGTRQYGGVDRSGPMGEGWGDNRQLPAEIRERLREAQDLRREWGTSGINAGRLDEVIEELKRLADGKMEGDAATSSYLKNEVVEPLRQLELELSRQLQQQSGRTNLRLRDEGAAPEKYRKAVEEYYRRLSGARQKQ